jgi:hypothetical protein
VANFSGSSEDQNDSRNVDNEDWAYKVSDGMRTLLKIGLEDIHITFWQ